jgi:hypothetical protein
MYAVIGCEIPPVFEPHRGIFLHLFTLYCSFSVKVRGKEYSQSEIRVINSVVKRL